MRYLSPIWARLGAIPSSWIARLEAELRELSSGDAARQELIEVDRVLAERRDLAITAARIAAPTYITAELGERPNDPAKRGA